MALDSLGAMIGIMRGDREMNWQDYKNVAHTIRSLHGTMEPEDINYVRECFALMFRQEYDNFPQQKFYRACEKR